MRYFLLSFDTRENATKTGDGNGVALFRDGGLVSSRAWGPRGILPFDSNPIVYEIMTQGRPLLLAAELPPPHRGALTVAALNRGIGRAFGAVTEAFGPCTAAEFLVYPQQWRSMHDKGDWGGKQHALDLVHGYYPDNRFETHDEAEAVLLGMAVCMWLEDPALAPRKMQAQVKKVLKKIS